jgi:hypothetical protein
MMPRLGVRYPIEIETISKPKAEYQTDDYFELDLPVAPAVMVGGQIVVEGEDVSEYDVAVHICRQLRLPPPVQETKGFFKKIFKA